jgi:hypothetical protein
VSIQRLGIAGTEGSIAVEVPLSKYSEVDDSLS